MLRPIDFRSVAWTDGFLAERVAVCREASIPAMGRLMAQGTYKPFLEHFEIAAGMKRGAYHGAQWNDGDFYKWLEAALASHAMKPDPALGRLIDRSIAAIAAAQREDGYLHTPILIRQRNGDRSAQPFGDRFAFEMYNMGHLMTTACLDHRTTGRTELLTVAEKAAEFLHVAFQNPTPELARNSVCPAHYIGLVDLARETGDPAHLELAERLFAMRDLVSAGGDDNQDRVPWNRQDEVVGHAVRANYLYCGAADLFAATGRETMFAPLPTLWHSLATKKQYVTGGCGALYDGASPDGAAAQEQITRIHQAYGRNYQLPQTTAHNETCANIAGMMWSWRMMLLTGEAKYADAVETALYNSVLAGVDLAGTNYFYSNPLRVVDPLPTELRFPRTRQPFFTSFCCPPNLLRIIAQVGGYALAVSEDAITANLYGSHRLTTTLRSQPLRWTMTTGYPWDGAIRISVDECPAEPFAVRLRIPAWADEAAITINGEPATIAAAAGSYAELRRRWSPGDVVGLNLPLRARLIEAHPLVEEATGQVAVVRGPIVYCLESADLPAGTKMDEIVLASDAKFVAQRSPDLFAGAATLRTTATFRKTIPWGDRLYRELTRDAGEPVGVQLVPYFAWNNRGPGEMSVWLRVE
ncbi:MAG: glycoside hydrolase family 127 protein [Pirellulales bacterium]|nr:glycoside hydrolase family 127 protein [Pirellulales bacterium]